MKKILVTGGAGYIGSHTVRELIKQQYEVVVLDSMESGHYDAIDPKAKLEKVDTADRDALKKVFTDHKIDAVIDFAAYLQVGESMEEPEKYLKNNILNFINLLDAMVKGDCQYVIKSSTAAVYGNPRGDSDIPWQEKFTEEYKPTSSALLQGKWQTEEVAGEEFLQKFTSAYANAVSDRPELALNEDELTKLRIPMSIYGLSKLLDEIILNKYNILRGIKFVALRYFNVCGAHPDGDLGDDKPKPSNLMTLTMLQALGKIPEIKIFGTDYETQDGTGVRDYIHPCDLATGHIKAVEYILKGEGSEIINLGTGKGSSVFEVIAAVEKASGKKIVITHVPRRSGDPSVSIANSGKANKLLDWSAEFDIEGMAQTAWKWHSENPNGFAK